MIVTIDGPAGTGKSTVARLLAAALGYEYLDTGAMYRMIAYHAVKNQIDVDNPAQVQQLATEAAIDFRQGRAFLNDVDVTDHLRDPDVSVAASFVAQNPQVRDVLVDRQRELATGRDIVVEGRDQGTVVFPDAECKFFLTAAPEIRAQRRLEELAAQGKVIDYDQLLQEQNERDRRDESRTVAPLRPADDAQLIDTTPLSVEAVVQQLQAFVAERSA